MAASTQALLFMPLALIHVTFFRRETVSGHSEVSSPCPLDSSHPSREAGQLLRNIRAPWAELPFPGPKCQYRGSLVPEMDPEAGVTSEQLMPELRTSGGSLAVLLHPISSDPWAYPDLTLCPSRPSLPLRGGSCVRIEARMHYLPWLGLLGTCRQRPRFPFLSTQRDHVFPVGLFPLDFVPGLPFSTVLSPASL